MIDWRWPEVDELESQCRWNEAKSLLIENWTQNPKDLKSLIRLGFFCWYILVESGPLNINDVDFDDLETTLHKVSQFGMEHFIENEDFLWAFGYMIALFPEYFGEIEDYEQWERKGKSMLKRAYDLSSDDPVYKYSYLGSKAGFQQVQAVLKDRFQGEGLLAGYFRSVWHFYV
ncbi:MAG: hypothetical protein ACQEWW_01790 [Bacillota bacterium]